MKVSRVPEADPNTVWSTWLQSVEWIDASRERRFRDELRDLLWQVLGLAPGATVVDVGCGGGALTRVLARWLGPGCTVYGVDRDTGFLAHARRCAREERLQRRTRYLHGDALALPLPDDCADVVTSYTLAEHVPDTGALLGEKMRVCRAGGRVSLMQVRAEGGFSSSPKRSAGPTDLERRLWKRLEKAHRRVIHEPWRVGATLIDLAGLPALFEQLGLVDVMVDAFATVNARDDARLSRAEALRALHLEEMWLLVQADRCAQLLPRPLPAGHLASLRRCIRSRFRKRRHRIEAGIHDWDFRVGVSWVVSGRKPRHRE